MKLLIMLVIVAVVAVHACLLVSIAYADLGTATFYNPPYVPSECHGYKNDGGLVAGASEELWNNSAACGKFYQVKCIVAEPDQVAVTTDNPCKEAIVVVQIVDRCGPGCQGTINLSRDAFSLIANNTRTGLIDVQYFEYLP